MRKIRKCQERRCKILARMRANKLKKINLNIKRSKLYVRRKKRKFERASEPRPFISSKVLAIKTDDISSSSGSSSSTINDYRSLNDCKNLNSSSSDNATATTISTTTTTCNDECCGSSIDNGGGDDGNGNNDALVNAITNIDRTTNMKRVTRRIILDCLVRLVRAKFPTITRRDMFKNLKFFAKILYLLASSVGMANTLIQILNAVISD